MSSTRHSDFLEDGDGGKLRRGGGGEGGGALAPMDARTHPNPREQPPKATSRTGRREIRDEEKSYERRKEARGSLSRGGLVEKKDSGYSSRSPSRKISEG